MTSPTETAHVEPSGHHDSGSFGHEEHHAGPSDMRYIQIALGLAVVTGCEVALTYMNLPHALFMTLLLSMMAFKFMMVVLFFMHLRYDAPIFRRLFYIGLGLAIFVYTVALFTFHFFAD